MNRVIKALGTALLKSTENEEYDFPDITICVNGQNKQIPNLMYLFWEQFLTPSEYNYAKKTFKEAGLDDEIFDYFIESLSKEGLLEIIS